VNIHTLLARGVPNLDLDDLAVDLEGTRRGWGQVLLLVRVAGGVSGAGDGGTEAVDLTGAGGAAGWGRILLLVRVVGGFGGTGDGGAADDRS
jgi:hypothetical protein